MWNWNVERKFKWLLSCLIFFLYRTPLRYLDVDGAWWQLVKTTEPRSGCAQWKVLSCVHTIRKLFALRWDNLWCKEFKWIYFVLLKLSRRKILVECLKGNSANFLCNAYCRIFKVKIWGNKKYKTLSFFIIRRYVFLWELVRVP